MTREELRRLCELPGHSGYTAEISAIRDGCLLLLNEVATLEAQKAQIWGVIETLNAKVAPLEAQVVAVRLLHDNRKARVKELERALTDIAEGMAPPDVMAHLETESPELFRGRMWSWSQRRAREAK